MFVMKKAFLLSALIACAYPFVAFSGSGGSVSAANPAPGKPVTVKWVPPDRDTSGNPIALSRLGGYRVYVGDDASNLQLHVDVTGGEVTQYTLKDLAPGSYVLALTAYDVDGNESAYSRTSGFTVLKDNGFDSQTSSSHQSNIGDSSVLANWWRSIMALR